MKKTHLLGAVCGSFLMLAWTPVFGVTAYDIATISLTDADHTRSTDNYRYSYSLYMNEAGQVLGTAFRYSSATDNGTSTWLYNGTTTLNIGLTDAGHTNSSTGYQSNSAYLLNEAGQVTGNATRFNGATSTGRSVWLYNGTTTLNIGLTDAGHTNSSTDEQINDVNFLNDAGQVTGTAFRYNGAMEIGQSAWLYNGTTTLNIGLTDAGHTSDNGYQNNTPYRPNEAGQVLGTAERFNGAMEIGQSAWLYNGTTTQTIGLMDAGHTRDDGDQVNQANYLNEAGQAAGYAYRYNGATDTGRSAWLYNGTTTQQIGLTDAGHTRSTDDFQYNDAYVLNEAGQVLGTADRYSGATYNGRSAWLYNGTTTQAIGLTDAGHTDSSTGYQSNVADLLNEAGQVAGDARRFNGATDTGRSAWLYNGTTTEEIGLTGTEHTRDDGTQFNGPQYLNEAGQVLGAADRYSGATYNGRSAWLYNGTITEEIGLTDAGHTRDDGYQHNYANYLNEAGQAVGGAKRFNGAAETGWSAWFYDATIDQAYSMDWSINPTDGYAYSTFSYLGDDGLGLGYYDLFDSGGASLGSRAFSFTLEDGFLDLGSLVADLSGEGWLYLANAIRGDGAGQIIGTGLLDDMTSGEVAYLLAPKVVPVPPAVWLFGSGLIGLVGMARRKRA